MTALWPQRVEPLLGWAEGQVRKRATEATVSVEVIQGPDQAAREGRTLLAFTVRGSVAQHDRARGPLLEATGSYHMSINE